jgi:hypothetical protein
MFLKQSYNETKGQLKNIELFFHFLQNRETLMCTHFVLSLFMVCFETCCKQSKLYNIDINLLLNLNQTRAQHAGSAQITPKAMAL